jgi:hypothetical protein
VARAGADLAADAQPASTTNTSADDAGTTRTASAEAIADAHSYTEHVAVAAGTADPGGAERSLNVGHRPSGAARSRVEAIPVTYGSQEDWRWALQGYTQAGYIQAVQHQHHRCQADCNLVDWQAALQGCTQADCSRVD